MAVYIKNPNCPHCSCELDLDDTIDFEYDDEALTLHQVGTCPECGRVYQWQRVATLIDWGNVEMRLVG